MKYEPLGSGLARLTIDRGFMDVTNLAPLLERAIARFHIPLELESVTYCLGRETFLATSAGSMGTLSESLFAFLVSIDNLPISFFFGNASTNTLPVVMLSYLQNQFDPAIAAIGTVQMGLALLLLLVVERIYGLKALSSA